MRKREAMKLHNRDEVRVKSHDGTWGHGYVLGEPREVENRVIVPVNSDSDGYREVDHTDIR